MLIFHSKDSEKKKDNEKSVFSMVKNFVEESSFSVLSYQEKRAEFENNRYCFVLYWLQILKNVLHFSSGGLRFSPGGLRFRNTHAKTMFKWTL